MSGYEKVTKAGNGGTSGFALVYFSMPTSIMRSLYMKGSSVILAFELARHAQSSFSFNYTVDSRFSTLEKHSLRLMAPKGTCRSPQCLYSDGLKLLSGQSISKPTIRLRSGATSPPKSADQAMMNAGWLMIPVTWHHSRGWLDS